MTQRQMGYHSTAWLWWTAVFFLTVGATVTYILSQQRTDPSARGFMSISLAITCIGFGLPVILATANWWLKR